MNNTDPLKMMLSSLTIQLPILIVCLVAGFIILVRWKQASRGSVWALLGFGLAAFLCIAIPVVQTSVQNWVVQNSDFAPRAQVFAALGFLWSVLRAVTYALLLVAVLAGRSAPRPEYPPSPTVMAGLAGGGR